MVGSTVGIADGVELGLGVDRMRSPAGVVGAVVVGAVVGETVGFGLESGRTASGSGMNGVFGAGPPSRLLASSRTYPAASTASTAPRRRTER